MTHESKPKIVDIDKIPSKEVKKVMKMVDEDLKVAFKKAKEIVDNDMVFFIRKEKFFSHIAVEMQKNITTDIPIAAVNVIRGISNLYIHPINYPALEKRERIGVLIHEVCHLILYHIFRREGKDSYIWNLATDCAINQMIPNNAEIGLPEGCILPETFRKQGIDCPDNLSADEYYIIIKNNKDKLPDNLNGSMQQGGGMCPNCGGSGEEGSGEGNSDASSENNDNNGTAGDSSKKGKPCSCCNGTGKSSESKQENWHKKWEENEGNEKVNEAAVKKQIKEAYGKHAGDIPKNLRPLIEEIIASKQNWKAILRMFSAKYIQSKVLATYKRESRRLGSLAKGRRKSRKLKLIVMVDTSASISKEYLAQFTGEIMAIWSQDVEITIIECDVVVHNVYQFNGNIERLKYEGRGGTSFIPPFEKVVEDKMDADAIIFLTDGFGEAPDNFHIPTLWVLTPDGVKPHDSTRKPVKWGNVIQIN